MTTALMQETVARPEAVVARDTGLIGRVTVSWAVAGGLLLGGFLVAMMTLAGRLSGNALLLTAGVLYVIGAALGFVHGAVLGVLGRPQDMDMRTALRRLGMAALYAMPAVAVGFVAAGWMAMTTVAMYLDRPAPFVGVVIGWVVGTAVLAHAVVNGVRAMRNAYARWPDRRLGTVLVAATFGALLILFLADRPELWGARLRVTEVGAVLLALVGAFWVAGPVVTLGLGMLRRMPGRHPVVGVEVAPRGAASLALGLLAGVVLGLAMLPFQQAAFGLPTADPGTFGGAVVLVSQALVDEVLLRLFAVTGIVWALMRWQHMTKGRAAVTAIVAAAFAQVAVYMPGVREIGFAHAFAAAGFVAMTVVVPAIVFGVLYWRRGFMTALAADAMALVVLALLL